jgi:hypothetical protein
MKQQPKSKSRPLKFTQALASVNSFFANIGAFRKAFQKTPGRALLALGLLVIGLFGLWSKLPATPQKTAVDSAHKSRDVAPAKIEPPAVVTTSPPITNTATTFAIMTDDRSEQRLLSSKVTAETAQISAKTESTNVVQDSSINAKSTLLHASGGSKNFVTGTTFDGDQGSVGMERITATGDVSVRGSSVGFGPGGMVGFGPGSSLGFGPPEKSQSRLGQLPKV